MNKEEIEDYIKKLKEFETELSNEDDLDFNFINELNGVLNKINTDIKNETQETPIVNNSLVVKVKKDIESGNLVSKSGEDYLTICYERLGAVFVEAIKELRKENIELKERLKLLEDVVQKLISDKK
jgi:hypothetical protein